MRANPGAGHAMWRGSQTSASSMIIESMRSRVSACLLIFCVVVTTISCRQDDNSIRFAVNSVPVLDPRFAVDAVSVRLSRLIYRPLVDFGRGSQLKPGLVRWQYLSPTRIRMDIETGAVFHDGSPVTVADIKATLLSIMDPKTNSPYGGIRETIERIQPQTDTRFELELKKEDPFFLTNLIFGVGKASQMTGARVLEKHLVGNGGFRFVSRPHQEKLVIERLSDGQIFKVMVVKDPTVRALKLIRGEVDLLQNDLSPELVAYLKKRGELKFLSHPGTVFTYLGFNLEDSHLKNPAVRRAIALSIDRREIIRHVWGGGARIAHSLLPPEHWAGHDALPAIEYDPAKARALLRASGYKADQVIELVYKTSTDPFRVRLATVIQHQLHRHGFRVKLQSIDFGTLFSDIKQGRFQMYSLSWVAVKSPAMFKHIFHSASIPVAGNDAAGIKARSGANRGRYRSEEADRLMDAALVEKDPNKQRAYFFSLQELLLRDLPYVPLWYENHFAFMGPRIDNYQLALDGNYDGLLQVRRRQQRRLSSN